jgi:hypothetical protein
MVTHVEEQQDLYLTAAMRSSFAGFHFFNQHLGGCPMKWYCVTADQTPHLKRAVRSLLPSYTGVSLSEDNAFLYEAFLYTKQLLIPPAHLLRHGVQLLETDQVQHEAVVGAGVVWHFGICWGGPLSLGEAVNFVPETWIKFGPQHVREWLVFAKRVLEAVPELRDHAHHLFSDRTLEIFLNHVPRQWSLRFFRVLLNGRRDDKGKRKPVVALDARTRDDLLECVRLLSKDRTLVDAYKHYQEEK